jgi:hypothetical protein
MEIRHLYNSLLLAESHLCRFERQDYVPEMMRVSARSRVAKLRAELERHPDRFSHDQERAYLARQAFQHVRRTAFNKGACNTCEHYQWNILVRSAQSEDALDRIASEWLNAPGDSVVCEKTGLLREERLKDLCMEYSPDRKGMQLGTHHGAIHEKGLEQEAAAWKELYRKYRLSEPS